MSPQEDVTLPGTRPKSRKSLGHILWSQEKNQENTTAFTSTLVGPGKVSEKLRSKSIGPGGIDALKDSTGNRRKSLAVAYAPPKSILKSTIPPLQEIPAHISTRKPTPKESIPSTEVASDMLIDISIDGLSGPKVTGADILPNPFQVEGSVAVNETRVTIRTEEEQQVAAREREERERKELGTEVHSRKDVRRKSLANRRVSFAPEATLHTWDVVVEYQDSTTSSNSTNPNRTASSAVDNTPGAVPCQTHGSASSDLLELPSTPPEQVEEETVSASPARQRDLHQKKRRRVSGIPPMNFNNPENDASSPFSSSSAGDDDEVLEDDEDDGSNSKSGSEDDNGTLMSIDVGETTNLSLASLISASSSSSVRLEEALSLASRQAGTQGILFDEHGGADMPELEGEEFVASFTPSQKDLMHQWDFRQGKENVDPFSTSIKAAPLVQVEDNLNGDEMTMEMTHAVGGILRGQHIDNDRMPMDVIQTLGNAISDQALKTVASSKKSVQPGRRQSARSLGERLSLGDETMDLTIALGGLQPSEEETVFRDDEDMTMELTSVVGGVLPQGTSITNPGRRASMASIQKAKQGDTPRESLEASAGDETMDITVAGGVIMPLGTESVGDLDVTFGMDMTTALGSILPPHLSTGTRSQAKKLMELETDLGSSPFQTVVVCDSPQRVPAPVSTFASETGSPSVAAFRGKGLRRSTDGRHSMTPISKIRTETPIKKPTTPSKQITPQPARPTTPGKTPPSKNVIMRTSSPKRLFRDKVKLASGPQSSESNQRKSPDKLFQRDKETGLATPNFVLVPQRRSSSGIGIDKEGLGSPHIAALLDRRGSIGDHARSFVPSSPSKFGRVVQFDDHHVIEEIDREREQEENCENGRKILECEVDQPEQEKDATLNLKEMIRSLSPNKKPLKGRKSLHVGAAKGILGKRPIELDEDNDNEGDDGIKRLKGHRGSPVKNVKLLGPPSKTETTGRLTRAARKGLETRNNSTTPIMSSLGEADAVTPRGQGRFKHAEVSASGREIVSFTKTDPVGELQSTDDSLSDDRIQLQDFLNMTSIRFMELTTTKRRHTVAPNARGSKEIKQSGNKASLEDCVAAGAATIPLLELFQHACHELKNYISEGRKTVREIETETLEENPPLFREYISAPADIKIVMDSQLKNVKTHARLLSKDMWYEWRLTLLATLRDGFFKMAEGMEIDGEMLGQQQSLLDSILPQLIHRMEQLEREESDLQSAAEELANCDQAELNEARQCLIKVNADIEAKKESIAELRRQLQGKELEISEGAKRREACIEDVREAEKIREECRGWSSNEISALEGKVDNIEKTLGWTITGVSGTTISMTYRKEIELVFDASSFQSNDSTTRQATNSRIDLWYIAANREHSSFPLSSAKEFFLQIIRDRIRGLPQVQTQVKDLLVTVGKDWNKANAVEDDIRLLNTSTATEITKTSDSSILVKSMLLLSPLATKVEISFYLTSRCGRNGINVEISPYAKVVYGERFNEPRMRDFLLSRCGDDVEERGYSQKVSWGVAVAELGDKLLARGRKVSEMVTTL